MFMKLTLKADFTGEIDEYEFAHLEILLADLLLLKDGQQVPLTPITVKTLLA
jgi:hypothetical protein